MKEEVHPGWQWEPAERKYQNHGTQGPLSLGYSNSHTGISWAFLEHAIWDPGGAELEASLCHLTWPYSLLENKIQVEKDFTLYSHARNVHVVEWQSFLSHEEHSFWRFTFCVLVFVRMYVKALCECVHVCLSVCLPLCLPGAVRSQKRVLMVMSYNVSTGNPTWVLYKVSNTLNDWAISPVPRTHSGV